MTKLCECGCGQPAPIATKSNKKFGHTKGEPVRFIAGHNMGPRRDGTVLRLPCNICRRTRSLSKFPVKSRHGKRAYYSTCFDCLRYKRFEQKYGLTKGDYTAMMIEQDFKCKICQEELTNTITTHVDHCHTTGVVRGILCVNCNRLLGAAKDSTEILREAIRYLEG